MLTLNFSLTLPNFRFSSVIKADKSFCLFLIIVNELSDFSFGLYWRQRSESFFVEPPKTMDGSPSTKISGNVLFWFPLSTKISDNVLFWFPLSTKISGNTHGGGNTLLWFLLSTKISGNDLLWFNLSTKISGNVSLWFISSTKKML